MLDRYLKVGLESLWLGAIVLIPLTFLSRDYITSEAVIGYLEVPKVTLLKILVMGIVILWLVEWRVRSLSIPSKWILGTVVLFWIVTVISSLFSDVGSISFWGEIPGQDSYSLYTVGCYVVLFGVVGTHLRSKDQLDRLLTTVCIVGTVVGLYAIIQHYGWDPLNLLEHTGGGRTRVTSFMGNSIFLGSFLSLSIGVSIILLVRNWFWGIPTGIQLLGLVFTLSRGPWLGLAACLGVFLFLGWMYLERRYLLRLLVPLGVGVVVLGLVTIPYSSYILERFGSTSSIVSRETNWSDSLRLISERPWFEFDQSKPVFLQHFIGYGPDTLRFTYLLVSRPHGDRRLPMEPDHAHNYFLHQWVEQGGLGLVTSISLFLVPIGVGILQLRNTPYSDRGSIYTLVLVGLISVLVGRMVEQLFGVARISDLVLFWVLLGGLTAVCSKDLWSEQLESKTVLDTARSSFVRLGVTVWFVGAIVAFTWVQGISHTQASIKASRGLDHSQNGDLLRSVEDLETAIQLSPTVPTYYSYLSTVYTGCLQSRVCPPEALQEIHRLNTEAVLVNPYYWRSRLRLAHSTWALGNREGGIELYEEVVSMVPSSWTLQNRLAEAYLDLGQPQKAQEVLQSSLSITGTTPNSEGALAILKKLEEYIP